jgi:hypothetical protein
MTFPNLYTITHPCSLQNVQFITCIHITFIRNITIKIFKTCNLVCHSILYHKFGPYWVLSSETHLFSSLCWDLKIIVLVTYFFNLKIYFWSSSSFSRMITWSSAYNKMLFISLIGPFWPVHSELNSETINPFRYFGRTPWMGDQPVAKSLPSQDMYWCLQTHDEFERPQNIQ